MQPVHPRRNPLIPIITTRPGFIRFGQHRTECQLSVAERDWFNALTGDCDSQAAIEAFIGSVEHSSEAHKSDSVTRSHLALAIEIGLQSGALIDSHVIPVSSRWVSSRWVRQADTDQITVDYTNERLLHPHRSTEELARAIDARFESPIHIVGSNYLSQAITQAAKVASIPTTADPLAAALIVFPSVSHPLVSDYDFVELERRPHLHVGIRHTRATVGPLVVPGESSCIRCAHLHHVDQDSTWPMQTIGWRNSVTHSTADPLLTQLTANFSLCAIRSWLDGQPLTDLAWRAQLPVPIFAPATRSPHPFCSCRLAM